MATKPPVFRPDQFTPTQFSTAVDKARFANQFVKFVTKGFARSAFPKWFYVRLSNTFGHIAHYDIGGFYGTFFASGPSGLEAFFRQTLHCGGHGDPRYTFCDVENALKAWLRDTPEGQAALHAHHQLA